MVYHRRITPDGAGVDFYKKIDQRLKALESPPSGPITIRDQMITTDPNTGVSTIFGLRPDGSYGLIQNVGDFIPPGKPTTPTALASIGAVSITWDGQQMGDVPLPEDYSRTVVQYRKGIEDFKHGGTLYGAESVVVPALEVGKQYSFRLVSYDTNENPSEPSDIAIATPVAMQDNAEVDDAIRELREADNAIIETVEAATGKAQQALDDLLIVNGNVTNVTNLAKSKVRTFTGATAPTGLTNDNIGDLWIDSAGQISRWQLDAGVAKWILVTDNGLAASQKALTDLGINQSWVTTIKSQADKAITTFFGTTQPTGMEDGDLWLTGVLNDPMKRYTVGVGWANFENPAIRSAYDTAASAAAIADSKIRTFAQSAAPTGLTDKNVGDLWIDTDDGKVSRWQIVTGTTYGWVQVSDNGASLVGSINAKGKVIIQSAEPATADRLPQNLWIDTTPITTTLADGTTSTGPGNILKRWNASAVPPAWQAVTDKAIIDAATSALKAQTDATSALEKAGQAFTAAGGRSRVVHLNVTPPIPEGGWNDEDVWYKHKTTAVDSPVIEWYRWKSGAWVKQVMDETFIPLLNIGTATTGFLRGTRIEAKSLSTEQLLITSLDNLVQDGDFSGYSTADPYTAAAPKTSWSLSGTAISIQTGQGRGGANALRFTGSTTQQVSTNLQAKQALNEGQAYRGNAWIKSSVALPIGAVQLVMNCFATVSASTPTSTIILAQNNAALVANTWTSIDRYLLASTATIPAGTVGVTFAIRVTNTATTALTYVDTVQVARATDGNLIVDGAFTGKTITGALIQSLAEPYMGIKWSGNQLIAYDGTGTASGETLRIDGQNGTVTLKGRILAGSTIEGSEITGGVFRTKMTGKRIVIQDQSYGSDIRLYPLISDKYASISFTSAEEGTGDGTGATNLLQIEGPPDVSGGQGTATINLQSGGIASMHGATSAQVSGGRITLIANTEPVAVSYGGIYTLAEGSRQFFLDPGFCEFTASQSPIVSGRVYGPGIPAITNKMNCDWAAWSTNDTMRISRSGLYTFNFAMSVYSGGSPAAVTGRSFVEIKKVDDQLTNRVSIAPGEDSGSATVTTWMSAGSLITFKYFQTSGGDKNCLTWGRITRLYGYGA